MLGFLIPFDLPYLFASTWEIFQLVFSDSFLILSICRHPGLLQKGSIVMGEGNVQKEECALSTLTRPRGEHDLGC